jgi:hypothetical protein
MGTWRIPILKFLSSTNWKAKKQISGTLGSEWNLVNAPEVHVGRGFRPTGVFDIGTGNFINVMTERPLPRCELKN